MPKKTSTYTGITGRDAGKIYHLTECDVRDNFKIGMMLANAVIPKKQVKLDGEEIELGIQPEYESLEGVTDWLITNESAIYAGDVQVTTDAILLLIEKCVLKHELNGIVYIANQGYDTAMCEEKSSILELFFALLRLHSVRFAQDFTVAGGR